MSLSGKTIGVIGAGVMGKALVRGLLNKKVVSSKQLWSAVKTPESCQVAKKELGIDAYTNYKDVLPETDVLLLCVKPSGMPQVLKTLRDSGLPESAVVISIVAGNTIETMESGIGRKNPVIRAMTNTPCVVAQGMSVICAGKYAKKDHMKLAQEIFEAVGVCMSMDETHFDAITALSGSGPAYLYLIMEALADGGVRVGLPRNAALQIVAQMVLGAATMVKHSGRHPATLKDDVTTPAGCTIGALLTMEDGKIRSVLARAVEEATRIAGGLGDVKK